MECAMKGDRKWRVRGRTGNVKEKRKIGQDGEKNICTHSHLYVSLHGELPITLIHFIFVDVSYFF